VAGTAGAVCHVEQEACARGRQQNNNSRQNKQYVMKYIQRTYTYHMQVDEECQYEHDEKERAKGISDKRRDGAKRMTKKAEQSSLKRNDEFIQQERN
jgi:hypothetical protein